MTNCMLYLSGKYSVLVYNLSKLEFSTSFSHIVVLFCVVV